MVCLQTTNSASSGVARWRCRGGAGHSGLTASGARPVSLLREDFALSERAMRHQQWTVSRRLVGHPSAQRRWDKAYQLLLQVAGTPPSTTGTPAAPQGA